MTDKPREIPTAGLAAYRSFWRHLKVAAEIERVEIPPKMRNAIRNAWRDGYWAGTRATGEELS